VLWKQSVKKVWRSCCCCNIEEVLGRIASSRPVEEASSRRFGEALAALSRKFEEALACSRRFGEDLALSKVG